MPDFRYIDVNAQAMEELFAMAGYGILGGFAVICTVVVISHLLKTHIPPPTHRHRINRPTKTTRKPR